MYYLFVLSNITDPRVPYYPRKVNFEGPLRRNYLTLTCTYDVN